MRSNRRLLFLTTLLATWASPAMSMHIMEGYLPARWCIFWGALSLPFVVYSFIFIHRIVRRSPIERIRLALSAAYIFVLTALKLPSVSGSSSHLTGTPMGAIYIGPYAMPVLSLIVLLFQSLLLAHGGITSLGANVFSLGIFGPFVTYIIYRGLTMLRVPWGIIVIVAAFVGSISTYICTSLQLAMAYPGEAGIYISTIKFMTVFAVTQIPLSLIEALLTVFILRILTEHKSTILTTQKKGNAQ